jgi:hypothetical protein
VLSIFFPHLVQFGFHVINGNKSSRMWFHIWVKIGFFSEKGAAIGSPLPGGQARKEGQQN